jgi:hypothetical protein
MNADEIIEALTIFSNKFPREALSEAPRHREELTPRLLDSLDYIAENAKKLMDEGSDYHLHFFAMFLLAQFREQRAFPKLVRLLHEDSDTLDFIAGDALTEKYKAILCSTYNGDIDLLKAVIEDGGCYEFARGAALIAYSYIVRDGHISRKEMTDYFRHVISGLAPDDVAGASVLVDVIVDEHIIDLIPQVRSFYDRDLIDIFFNGHYDSFLNDIFNYTYNPSKKLHIDDVVAELEHWACYAPENPPKPVKPKPVQEKTAAAGTGKKKIGRNDPCPCGSGKKYKKCCLPKGLTFKDKTVKKETVIAPKKIADISTSDFLRGLGMYDETKPYNLLNGYPGLDPKVKEGEHKFAEFFSPEAIAVDIPVYKTLHHRAIPLWVKRDMEKEDKERITLLLDAFDSFTRLCDRDGIDSFSAYDEKYMVHYHADRWIACLQNLLEQYKDEIPTEQYAMLESVSQTRERMNSATA